MSAEQLHQKEEKYYMSLYSDKTKLRCKMLVHDPCVLAAHDLSILKLEKVVNLVTGLYVPHLPFRR